MKTLFKLLILMVVLTVCGAAVFIHFSDKQVVVLADGTIKTVDAVWESESGNLIAYEVGGERVLLKREEIKRYGKRSLGYVYQEAKKYIINHFEKLESSLNRFFRQNNISVGLSFTQNLFLLLLLLFLRSSCLLILLPL